MKTTVCIPDHIFQEAERLARFTKKKLTRQMNAALAGIGETSLEFATLAGRRVLERNDW